MIQRNKFVCIKKTFFESTKLSLIQRNFFFVRISKECFFDSKKLFSGCGKNLRNNSFNFIIFERKKVFLQIKENMSVNHITYVSCDCADILFFNRLAIHKFVRYKKIFLNQRNFFLGASTLSTK